MGDEQSEDKPFVTQVGPLCIDWPRTIGFYGGIAAAVALEVVAPELALFVAIVPLVKLFKRRHATKVERAIAAVVEGAAKPVGGDAEATIKPKWLAEKEQEDKERLERTERAVEARAN